MLTLQVMVCNWSSLLAKLLVVIGGTFAFTLLTYHFGVRYTSMGQWLEWQAVHPTGETVQRSTTGDGKLNQCQRAGTDQLCQAVLIGMQSTIRSLSRDIWWVHFVVNYSYIRPSIQP